MLRLLIFVFLLLPVMADAQTNFVCEISTDKLSLRVLVTNPYDRETHCQVNCHIGTAGGGTISASCGRTVPGKAAAFLLCAQQRENKAQYGVVLSSSNSECVKPLAESDGESPDEANEFNRLAPDTLEKLKGLRKID